MALTYDYSVSGVIPINTDVQGPTPVLDARSINIRVLSLGTTGVLTVQGSEDGVTYGNIPAKNSAGTVVSTINAVGMYQCPVYYNFIRVRLTTATTAGKTVVSVRLSSEPYMFPVPILATQPVSGTLSTNAVLSATVGTTLLYHKLPSALASTNATLLKASACRIARIRGYNAKAAVVFLKLFNKATAPVPGTDTPVLNFALKPSDVFDINVEALGIYLATGAGYSLSAGAADNDATALVAGDILGMNIMYV